MGKIEDRLDSIEQQLRELKKRVKSNGRAFMGTTDFEQFRETVEELVSRQNKMRRAMAREMRSNRVFIEGLYDMIFDVAKVMAQHWLNNGKPDTVKCSKCGRKVPMNNPVKENDTKTFYKCPHCKTVLMVKKQ